MHRTQQRHDVLAQPSPPFSPDLDRRDSPCLNLQIAFVNGKSSVRSNKYLVNAFLLMPSQFDSDLEAASFLSGATRDLGGLSCVYLRYPSPTEVFTAFKTSFERCCRLIDR